MVAATTLGALRLPDHGTRSALELLTHHLSRHRALIVLDNCEHLTDASGSLAAALLSACPGLRVLTTSRRTLRVAGESVHVLTPLSADGEAVELLRDRAAAVRPGFSITDANRAQAVRLCTELDGLPLAIELAAARLRSFTLEVTMERLTDRFALLTGGSRIAPPRHHSLRGTVEWSYELCTAAERLLWNRLAVFRGGFGLDAAEEVCAGDGIAPAGVLDLLDRLVAQSVVSTCDRDGLTRYQLPEILREYGYARLCESDRRRLLRRHRDFFLTLAERLALRWYGPGQQEALGRLRAEHANLRMALEYRNGSPANDGDDYAGVVPGADAQAGLALAAALRFHWCANGLLGEGRQQLDRALAAAPEPTLSRARALSAAAYLALLQADPATAQCRLDEVERLGHQLENPSVRAHAQGLRGTSALLADRPERALVHFEEALAIHRGARETVEPLFWLFQIAIAQSRLADPRAADTGRLAVALAQAHGERHCRSYALLALGYELWARGDAEQALPHIQAALEILRDFNDFIATSRAPCRKWAGSPRRPGRPAQPRLATPPFPRANPGGPAPRRGTGRSSFNHCGHPISNGQFNICWPGTDVCISNNAGFVFEKGGTNFPRYNNGQETKPGDSGAPIYVMDHTDTAAYIVGSNAGAYWDCCGTIHMVGVNLDYILASFNADLITTH